MFSRFLRARDGVKEVPGTPSSYREVVPSRFICSDKQKRPSYRMIFFVYRARDGTRTRGLDLGKVALHQLSHSRICLFRDAFEIVSNSMLIVKHII